MQTCQCKDQIFIWSHISEIMLQVKLFHYFQTFSHAGGFCTNETNRIMILFTAAGRPNFRLAGHSIVVTDVTCFFKKWTFGLIDVGHCSIDSGAHWHFGHEMLTWKWLAFIDCGKHTKVPWKCLKSDGQFMANNCGVLLIWSWHVIIL